MNCLNCGREIASTDNYCAKCGQNASTTRMDTKHAMHQFFHSFTHTDKGFFEIIPQLITRPGIIAREYNQGKRKTYFSPFTFMLIIVAISTILVAYTNLLGVPARGQEPPEAKMVNDFINKHFNIVVLFGIPVIAYFTSVFFKKRINFAESLVLVSYASGERSIFFILVVIPLVVLFKNYYFLIIYIYLGLFLLYYGWACCQYLQDYRFKTFLKGMLAVILNQLIVMALITLAIMLSYMIHRS